jgi:hypothetical protein
MKSHEVMNIVKGNNLSSVANDLFALLVQRERVLTKIGKQSFSISQQQIAFRHVLVQQ